MPDDVRVSQPQPTGRRNARLAQTVRDMVWSLVVVLGAVAVVLLITWRPQPEAIKVVDVAPFLSAARSEAGYPVLIPRGLAGLQATSARWEPTNASQGVPVWHVGYVLNGADYVQVSQARLDDPAYIAEQTEGGRPAGRIDVMGASWEKRESSDQRSLVLQRDGVTTIVTGTAPWDVLPTVAASLSAG